MEGGGVKILGAELDAMGLTYWFIHQSADLDAMREKLSDKGLSDK